MKASDLRIWNLILREGYDEDAGGNLFHDPEGDEVITVDIDTLKYIINPARTIGGYSGIPLTEEWLLKFGFKDGYLELEGQCISVHLDQVGLMGQDSVTGGQTFFCKCEYVHQLQNLYFALTGKELEINEA